ncbi:hypothetical protein [Kribbella alba]|uniref:hypothetical protein n=1 Tax=Kribbella alba TaxID=190197 RepID=UPI0031E2F3E5
MAHSDEGGDIMPLAGLFLETIERYVTELQRPKTFKKMFDQLVARRGDNYFEWYRNCLRDFMDRLRSELKLSGLHLTMLDELSQDVFDQLREGYQFNVRSAVIADDLGQEIMLYHRHPSTASRNRFAKDDIVPTIAFALPNRRWNLDPYRRASRFDLEGLSDLWIQPDRPVRVYVDDKTGVSACTVTDAASRLADRLRALRS